MSPSKKIADTIPRPAWAAAVGIVMLVFCASTLIFRGRGFPLRVVAMAPTLISAVVGAYILVVGYVFGDARQRRMRYWLWTLLAIFVPNGIGIVLYFVLRDPMPQACWRCGYNAGGLAYCPQCGAAVQKACPQCARPVPAEWRNCGYCGVAITSENPRVPA